MKQQRAQAKRSAGTWPDLIGRGQKKARAFPTLDGYSRCWGGKGTHGAAQATPQTPQLQRPGTDGGQHAVTAASVSQAWRQMVGPMQRSGSPGMDEGFHQASSCRQNLLCRREARHCVSSTKTGERLGQGKEPLQPQGDPCYGIHKGSSTRITSALSRSQFLSSMGMPQTSCSHRFVHTTRSFLCTSTS